VTDTVRLDIGDGALKNIYIKFGEVTIPAGLTNAGQLERCHQYHAKNK
jgi:hypothetical protein